MGVPLRSGGPGPAVERGPLATGESNAELVARARTGDGAACDLLVRRHLRAAYAVALAVVRDPAEAEDVAQDAFALAFERLDSCREPERFAGWLLQIVRNQALTSVDRMRLRGPTVDPASAPEVGVSGHAENAPLRAQLLSALSGLGAVQREVVLLHDLEGWTHPEIADALGFSELMSRQHLFQARRTLRSLLADAAPKEDSRGS